MALRSPEAALWNIALPCHPAVGFSHKFDGGVTVQPRPGPD